MRRYDLKQIAQEASQASQQAKKLGLTHAGWGKWKDKSGNVTHQTKDDKLVPVGGAGDAPSPGKKGSSADRDLGPAPKQEPKQGGLPDAAKAAMDQIGYSDKETSKILKKLGKTGLPKGSEDWDRMDWINHFDPMPSFGGVPDDDADMPDHGGEDPRAGLDDYDEDQFSQSALGFSKAISRTIDENPDYPPSMVISAFSDALESLLEPLWITDMEGYDAVFSDLERNILAATDDEEEDPGTGEDYSESDLGYELQDHFAEMIEDHFQDYKNATDLKALYKGFMEAYEEHQENYARYIDTAEPDEYEDDDDDW